MPAFKLEECARPNILALVPYRCARDDYKDDGTNILLDANENAYGPAVAPLASKVDSDLLTARDFLGLHRYPDPHQETLKEKLCALRNTHTHTQKTLKPENLFVGVGSDEAIDAVLRAFCVPGKDRILTCPPTYGMYSVSAQVNDVSIIKVPLLPAPEFGIDVPAVTQALSNEPNIKVVYFCSPGNPTGGALAKDDVRQVLEHPTWNGIVVVDEAYIDFAPDGTSLAEWVLEWPNLLVMQTLSKAFGMAGIRLGAAFGAPPVIGLLNNLKAPTTSRARPAPSPLLAQRDRLVQELPNIPGVGRLRGGLDSNFLLYEMLDAAGKPNNDVARAVYEKLAETKGVVVRFRGTEHGCLGCLRVTVGTEHEVTRLLSALQTALEEVRGA
ncbi:unnamed protein product [Parascedosporium putredinis]|uniref:histidinol-phosphate transaminase n=1 Tax=Parascedosporium putredinis TaxID=1442378 RepID=A0A9P1MBK8_9PEZI|nr:unnamed protein product [Parascedosporium putredinis]CAI7994999.1 unnamed protein product [Parascedosporium putredinis]